ncbi:MAG: membrane-bound ClpP family serine protease [Cyclobacteriaceae bacterium]|jgi:membrane-bound ClpP family serine protease
MMEWLNISALILVGIGLVIIEIIFVPGTTIVGILGFLMGGYGIYLGYDYFGNTTGHIVLTSSVTLAFVCIFYSFKSGAWKKFANKTAIKSKVNEGLTFGLKEGDLGQSSSSLKPIGKGIFNDKEYEVTSQGNFITEKQSIKIIKIEKNKIFVESSN